MRRPPSVYLLMALLVSVAFAGCSDPGPKFYGGPSPEGSRWASETPPVAPVYRESELRAHFNDTQSLLFDLETMRDLGVGSLVLEVVAEVPQNEVDLRVRVDPGRWAQSAEPPEALCARFDSRTNELSAIYGMGSLFVQAPGVGREGVRSQSISPRPIEMAYDSIGVRPAYMADYVHVAVHDLDAWARYGGSFSASVENGARVWWRVVATGTLSCGVQPSDYDAGTYLQTPQVTVAEGLEKAFSLTQENASVAVLWHGDLGYEVALQGPEGTLFSREGIGLDLAWVTDLGPGEYRVRYPMLRGVQSPVAAFLVEDLDHSLL